MEVHGAVEPGFEAVAEQLERSHLGAGGGAFAAYVDGTKVVDVWAGDAREGERWQSDTMTTAMSATKGLTALVMMMLHDRGVIEVDAPVARYWPEYAQNGKAGTTVRHILTHTCGVIGLQHPERFLEWDGTGWGDYDAIAGALAAAPPAWEPGTGIAYHAITYGWLCQEIVRRTTGETIGSYFAREVAAPLDLEAYIGTPEAEQSRVSELVPTAVEFETPELEAAFEAAKAFVSDPRTAVGQSYIAMRGSSVLGELAFMNLPSVRAVEIPAANASIDARSLARVYAALARGGELGGVRLASADTIRLFGTLAYEGPSAFLSADATPQEAAANRLRYALGFEGDFGISSKPWRFGPEPDSFGHLGAGGQIGFADPARRISVGFVRNHLADWSVSTALVDTLYDLV